jgi:hypothetical protein
LLHLLLDLLLLIDGGRSHHGFVLLQVVNKLPLFVFAVFVDDVNPLAFGGARYPRDASRVSGSEPGDRGRRLPRAG